MFETRKSPHHEINVQLREAGVSVELGDFSPDPRARRRILNELGEDTTLVVTSTEDASGEVVVDVDNFPTAEQEAAVTGLVHALGHTVGELCSDLTVTVLDVDRQPLESTDFRVKY